MYEPCMCGALDCRYCYPTTWDLAALDGDDDNDKTKGFEEESPR